MADVAHHAQVVRDEDIGQAQVALQVHQQVDDLRLHRHVQRRHRLVADDQRQFQRQRARDHDALALAAGELVRIALGGVGPQADAGQQLGHAFADGGAAVAEIAQRFADDVAHAHARVHRRERILEDELHAPAHGAQLLAVHRGQVLAFEQDAALGRISQPDQALAGGGLAAAGFTDQAQGLAARHRQRDAIDRAQDASAVDRIVFFRPLASSMGEAAEIGVHVSVP